MVEKSSRSINVLHFLLHDVHCCLDLRYIEKILPLPFLEHVPGSPVYFVGLMNFKRICVPVFDLALCIGLAREQTYPLNIPVLLCSDGIQQIGFIVDKVLGLDEILTEKIEIHEEFTKGNSAFDGAITLESGVSLLMNVPWMFAMKLTQEEQHATSHE